MTESSFEPDTMAEAKLIQKNMITRSPAKKKKRHGFTRKCSSLVQDQRARIYVFRRCATMLLCWYIQGDD
uniref:Uncharacterized protein n=1 Tax=Salix viminalis TaxID=40686 RepID=A0A6N2N472_SALVM